MNPIEIIKMFVMKNQNPMVERLINMADKGDSKGVETFARNLFKEKGKDFDKEFNDFMSQMKR